MRRSLNMTDSDRNAGWFQETWEEWRNGQIRDRGAIENPFGNAATTNSERSLANKYHGSLETDMTPGIFQGYLEKLSDQMPTMEVDELQRAAEVGRESSHYYHLARDIHSAQTIVELSPMEKENLIAERESIVSQRGMFVIICTISLAAFLQGHVQSSINAGSLFTGPIGIKDDDKNGSWELGAMNAIPFFAAAVMGAPLALPVNYCIGRRGSLAISALLIIASSLGSAFSQTWYHVLGARVVGGVGMMPLV